MAYLLSIGLMAVSQLTGLIAVSFVDRVDSCISC